MVLGDYDTQTPDSLDSPRPRAATFVLLCITLAIWSLAFRMPWFAHLTMGMAVACLAASALRLIVEELKAAWRHIE